MNFHVAIAPGDIPNDVKVEAMRLATQGRCQIQVWCETNWDGSPRTGSYTVHWRADPPLMLCAMVDGRMG